MVYDGVRFDNRVFFGPSYSLRVALVFDNIHSIALAIGDWRLESRICVTITYEYEFAVLALQRSMSYISTIEVGR